MQERWRPGAGGGADRVALRRGAPESADAGAERDGRSGRGGNVGEQEERRLPDDLESAFYAYLGFPEADNRTCQTVYADRFVGCDTVLDLACGRGEFLGLLQERGIRGIGVDSDRGMVRLVRDRGLEVVEQDVLLHLGADEPLVDGIYCAHFIEHIGPLDVLHLLSRARQRLRPGGRLIVATPNPACLHTQLVEFWRDLTHVRPYTLELLRFLLTYSGFEVVEAGVNPLRLLPRNALAARAEEARQAVAAAEEQIHLRRLQPANASPAAVAPRQDARLPRGGEARVALRRARDRVSGVASLARELLELRREIASLQARCAALETRLAGVDDDGVRLASALRTLQDVVGHGTRQLDDLFPSPEIFVMGIRR